MKKSERKQIERGLCHESWRISAVPVSRSVLSDIQRGRGRFKVRGPRKAIDEAGVRKLSHLLHMHKKWKLVNHHKWVEKK